MFSFNSPFEDLPERLHERIRCLSSIRLGVAQIAHMPWLDEEGLITMLLDKRI